MLQSCPNNGYQKRSHESSHDIRPSINWMDFQAIGDFEPPSDELEQVGATAPAKGSATNWPLATKLEERELLAAGAAHENRTRKKTIQN